METTLNNNQQETFNFFIKGFGSWTNKHENEINNIIITASSLIKEMEANGDLNHEFIRNNLCNCQDNISLLYEIFEKIKPTNEQDIFNEPSNIYFMLIMYSHWCESLRFIFNEPILKHYSDKNYISLRYFKKYFSEKYKTNGEKLFKERLFPPLRNAIAHNNIKIDSLNKSIEFYDTEQHKIVTRTFIEVVDIHDKFTMVYFCIVKELSGLILNQKH